MVVWYKVSHLEALPEAGRLRGLSLEATVRDPHQLAPLSKANSPADCQSSPPSVYTETSLRASSVRR